MSLERDDKVELSQAKTVTLGGTELTIAPLRLREVIAVAEMSPKLADSGPLSTDKINACIDALCIGLRRAHPNITREDILDLPASMSDLMRAALVVVEQSGGRKPPAGEAPAASNSTSSTGTSSSPPSA